MLRHLNLHSTSPLPKLFHLIPFYQLTCTPNPSYIRRSFHKPAPSGLRLACHILLPCRRDFHLLPHLAELPSLRPTCWLQFQSLHCGAILLLAWADASKPRVMLDLKKHLLCSTGLHRTRLAICGQPQPHQKIPEREKWELVFLFQGPPPKPNYFSVDIRDVVGPSKNSLASCICGP